MYNQHLLQIPIFVVIIGNLFFYALAMLGNYFIISANILCGAMNFIYNSIVILDYLFPILVVLFASLHDSPEK